MFFAGVLIPAKVSGSQDSSHSALQLFGGFVAAVLHRL